MREQTSMRPANVSTAAPQRCETHRGLSTVFWLAEHRKRGQSHLKADTSECACMHVHVCKHLFMWLYECAYVSLRTRVMEGTKETFPLTFDPGLCVANQTLCVFTGGVRGRVEPISFLFFCVSLSSPRPSSLSF